MTPILENSRQATSTGQKVLGLVAGEGKLPAILTNAARDKGYKVVVFALSEYARDSVAKIADKTHLIAVGQFDKNLGLFKKEGVKNVVFVGKVPKLNLLRNITKFDWTAVKEMTKLPNFNDDTIQFAVGDLLTANGLNVLTQSEFLRDLFPGVGVLTSRQPTPEEYGDIHYGMSVAKEIARLDIGQTVIVRDRMILAIEAIEGTDEAIKRAVALARRPVVVVKVSKPNQDQRFDIPTVGLNTLESLKAKEPGGVLAIEAKETMVIDRDEMVNYCNANGISLVAVESQ